MNNFWNVPNILTLFRLALVPVFLVVFFFWGDGFHIAALVVFVIACLTDVLDGIIARKTNQITKYGIVLDPLADKLLKGATLIAFAIINVIPLWLAITIITIDVGLIITGICLYKQEITIPSNFLGKAGTVVTSCGLVLCFFYEYLAGWNLYILYAGLATIVASVIYYICTNYKRVFCKNDVVETTATKVEENEEETTCDVEEIASEDEASEVVLEATAVNLKENDENLQKEEQEIVEDIDKQEK